MFPDRILREEMEVAEGSPERPRSVSKVRKAAKLVLCRACGKLRNAGRACRHCGHTDWRPIALFFVVALALKAGAVSFGLFAANIWLSNLAFWIGSLLGGFLFLGVVIGVMDAYHAHRARNRSTPEPASDPTAESVTKPVPLASANPHLC
jgi:ribosomal protein L32